MEKLYERGCTVFSKGSTQEQLTFTDSINAHRSAEGDLLDLELVWVAQGYRIRGEPRRSMELLDSVKVDPARTDPLVQYAMYTVRARGLKSLRIYGQALASAQHAQQLAGAFDLAHERVDALVLIAEIHRAMTEYEAALSELIEAERSATAIGYAKGLCNVAINRGNLYNVQERFPEARAKYKEAIACAESNGFPEIASNALFNEAGLLSYAYPDSVATALAILGNGLDYARRTRNPMIEADILSEMGRAHTVRNEFPQGIDLLKQALALRIASGDTAGRASTLLFLSTAYAGNGQQDSALAAVQESMGFCGNGKDKQRYAECLLRMATVLSALGRDKEAGEYFQRYITEHDELLEAKNAEALKVMEYRFGTEEKEEVIQLQAQQISSDRAKKIAMLMIALLSLLVAALLFRNNRHFRVVNAQQRQLHEREVNDLLHQQEIRALDAMLEGQETERKRIAQELHDRLGTMLSAIKLQFGALEQRLDEVRTEQGGRFTRLFTMLDDAVREVRRVSHDLLQSNLAKFGLPKALDELRETLQAPGKFEVELSMHGMQERLEPRLEVVIYRIVQECVSNTMKHAKASHLSIQLTRSQGMVNLLVEDDGRGFDLASVEEGMGMGNIRQRTADLGGTVHFDARQGRGTSVSVDIPLSKK